MGAARRPGGVMAREMEEQPAALRALLARRVELLARVRDAMPRQGRLRGVVLIARGSSDNAALYGRYLLENTLGVPVSLAAPSLWTRYGSAPALHGQLAVGVSQSGRTPEIADVLARAGRAGATTIAITNDGGSPLAAVADAALPLGVGREIAVPATKTFTAQLAAFALLAEALGAVPWLARDWARIPDGQERLLADERPVEDAARLLAGAQANVQLGRSFLYATALEGALKLTETSSLPSLPFSSADFLHGPLAVAAPATSVVAYAAPGPVAADVEQAARAAAAHGSPLVTVGQPLARLAALHLDAGDACEQLAPLLHAIRAQQLARATTLLLGRDPDRPPALSKVTATT